MGNDIGKRDEMTRAAKQQEQHLPSARGCTERVRKLRQEILTTPWEVCIERARWYTEVYARNAEQPIEVTRALAFRRTLEETPIRIYRGELLVGHRTSKRVGSPLFPEVKPAWIEAELDLFSSRELQRFQVSEEDKAVLRSEILPFWRKRGARDRFSALLPPEAVKRLGGGGVLPRAMNLRTGWDTAPPTTGWSWSWGSRESRDEIERTAGRARSHHSRRD